MSERDKTQYRVIEILNSKELLINYGRDNGAIDGQRIQIIKKGENVIDPDSKEILGTLDIIKGDLKIYRTYPKFSICRDITYKETSILDPIGVRMKTQTPQYHDLNIEDKDISGRWPISTPPIKVGDSITIIK